MEAPGADTGVDSDDSEADADDGRTAGAFHHLPRRLLRSNANVTVCGSDLDRDDEDDGSSTSSRKVAWKNTPPAFNLPEFERAVTDTKSVEFEEAIQEDTVITAFNSFFSEELINLIVTQAFETTG